MSSFVSDSAFTAGLCRTARATARIAVRFCRRRILELVDLLLVSPYNIL